MLNNIISVGIGIAPWTLGCAMLYALLYQHGRWGSEHHLFIIGSAAYIGYLWVALLMWILQYFTMPVFSDWLLALMVFSVLACCGASMMARLVVGRNQALTFNEKPPSCKKNYRPSYWLTFSLSTYLAILLFSVLWEITLRPAVAWDTLSFWADHGNNFLHGQLANDNLNVMSSRIHPATLKYVGAWGAFALYERSANGLYLPWLALYIGTILACVALGKLLSGRWLSGLIIALLIASNPLIQSHASWGGYADLWLGAGIFFCLGWLGAATRGVFQPTMLIACVAILLIFSLIFIKGNAVAYALILLCSLPLGWAFCKGRWVGLGLIGAIGVATFWVWHNGFDLTIAGYRLALIPEEGRIALGHREAPLASNSWIQIGKNFWHAWVIKSSFYLGSMLSIAILAIRILKIDKHYDFLLLTGLFFFFGLFTFFGLGLHFNEYQLYVNSSPESDTSLSRFSQVIYFVIAFLSLLLLSNWISRTQKNIK